MTGLADQLSLLLTWGGISAMPDGGLLEANGRLSLQSGHLRFEDTDDGFRATCYIRLRP